jgi:hypothetical protein
MVLINFPKFYPIDRYNIKNYLKIKEVKVKY